MIRPATREAGGWEIRRAGLDDLDDVMALETATFPSDAWSREGMRAELRGPHGYYLVARTPDGVLDGYGGLLAPRGAEQADVQTVAVADRARRRGLGRALVLALVAEAGRRGARELFLEVRADNPAAQALYAALGFEQVGRRARYYQPDDVDALVMRLDIPEGEVAPA